MKKKTIILSVIIIAVMAMAFQQVAFSAKKSSGKVKLKIDLPKPLFVGTPKSIRVPNLEKKKKGPRPAFYVPKGTKNVALNKPVTSSDMEPIIGELELVTDADKEAMEGSYVELGPGKQWVQIDLKKKYSIYAVLCWHYHSAARAYHDVVVRVANDADFISGVKTIFNNDHDNSSGFGIGRDKAYVENHYGKLIDAKGVSGRYIRRYSNGSTSSEMNHYIEVEVYGK